MKKSLKSTIAALLAVLMTFSSLTVFAADESDAAKTSIEWDYYDELRIHTYAGELIEGENTFSLNEIEDEFFYFTFTAPKAGYYELSYKNYYSDLYFYLPETYANGKAYNEVDGFYFDREERLSSTLYYVEEGEQIIGMHFYYSDTDSININIDYYGEEVSSVSVNDLIFGDDVYLYYGEGTNYAEIFSDVLISFSSGKTIKRSELYCSTNADNLAEGNNTITLDICNKKFEFVINVSYITKYIADIEISNIKDYLYVTEYYNSFDYINPYGETATVTFTDGTKQEIIFGEEEVVLPNGNSVWVDCYFDCWGDDATLVIYAADTDFKTYECKKEKAPVGDNFATLIWRNTESIKDASYFFRKAVAEIITAYSLEDLINEELDDAVNYFGYSLECFTYIFIETITLIRFYIA